MLCLLMTSKGRMKALKKTSILTLGKPTPDGRAKPIETLTENTTLADPKQTSQISVSTHEQFKVTVQGHHKVASAKF